MKGGSVRPPVDGCDPDQNVVRVRLGILSEYIEIPVLFEDARIQQLKLGVVTAAAAVLVNQPCIRKLGLRIFIEGFHVRVCRRAVEIKVALFHVLAMIAFAAREPE